MSKRSNTVPYTNAARAGRTKPGAVEMLKDSDPRLQGKRFMWNRSDRRRSGQRAPLTNGTARNPISRFIRRRQAGIASWPL